MKAYQTRKEQYNEAVRKLAWQYNIVSIIRLSIVVLIAIGIYFYVQSNHDFWWVIFGIAAVGFIVLIRVHDQLRKRKNLQAALLAVNTEELSYLKDKELPFENGAEFAKDDHAFTHDIDVFGEHSLFQHLNRTQTYLGKQKLGKMMQEIQSAETIQANQQAVQELSEQLDWRQRLAATARINRDSQALYENILQWCRLPNTTLPKVLIILAYLLPAVLVGIGITYLVTLDPLFSNLFGYLFGVNLILLYSQLKKIRQQILNADKVQQIIRQYGLLIKSIEDKELESPKLAALKKQLTDSSGRVSGQLSRLSSLFNSLDAIQNLLGAVLFNGFALYHLHILQGIIKWKNDFAEELPQWLDVIAELEALNSLANFSYNNPDFCFPELNNQYELRFQQLGHPLLKAEGRVDNDVVFKDHKFIILTGSNMSGKSTFLRALGVNMLLAGMGSCVCAKSASIHPMDIYVSMRLTDSLNDSESYFYAEIKRLHHIMSNLSGKRAFVLLDEILRGTNSDDKRNGTIAVIRKMVEYKALGAIATHDLEVCNTAAKYPNYLTNQRFEVEIIDNDLHFDYKLRPGICQNQSATFLMKKMGII